MSISDTLERHGASGVARASFTPTQLAERMLYRRAVEAVIWGMPVAPSGQDLNWAPTRSEGGLEVLFRFYGPERSLLDKAWVLPDIEKLGSSTGRPPRGI